MRSFVLLVVFSFLPCSRRLLRRLAAVFGGAAGARMSAQFLPVILAHVYAIMLGGFPDVGEGQFAVFVGNADRLVETGDSVSAGSDPATLLQDGLGAWFLSREKG